MYIHAVASKQPNAPPKKGLSLQGQLGLMEHARVIVGAHSAGLVSSSYAPDGATVVEFPMKPQCNRCFGRQPFFLRLCCGGLFRGLPCLSFSVESFAAGSSIVCTLSTTGSTNEQRVYWLEHGRAPVHGA